MKNQDRVLCLLNAAAFPQREYVRTPVENESERQRWGERVLL